MTNNSKSKTPPKKPTKDLGEDLFKFAKNSDKLHANDFRRQLPRSLFKGNRDHGDVVRIIDRTLSDLSNNQSCLGLIPISDLVKAIHVYSSELEYVGPQHITEVFLRDQSRVYRLDGDMFGRVLDNNGEEPPATLYFGTITKLKQTIIQNGIRSKSRPYFKLYESKEAALEFAHRFSSDTPPTPGSEKPKPCVLQVKSGDAFFSGFKFAMTRNPGEWACDALPSLYVLDV